MQGDALWSSFKRCAVCSHKIAPNAGHTLCFLCLGESYHPESCSHCLNFSRRTRKDRATRLRIALLQASLQPVTMASQSSQPSTSIPSASAATLHSVQTSSVHASPLVQTSATSSASTAPTQRPQSHQSSRKPAGLSVPAAKAKEKEKVKRLNLFPRKSIRPTQFLLPRISCLRRSWLLRCRTASLLQFPSLPPQMETKSHHLRSTELTPQSVPLIAPLPLCAQLRLYLSHSISLSLHWWSRRRSATQSIQHQSLRIKTFRPIVPARALSKWSVET